MAKVRSPNYPSIGLGAAIEKAELVYRKEHTHRADQEVIAKALGYKSLNGASMAVISSLRKYGLLEESEGGLRISTDALTILVDPKASKDRIEALKRAAFLPTLFSELRKEYGEGAPSDENLRSFLLKRGFSPNTVEAPIKSYRDTLTLVGEVTKGYPSEGTEKGNAPPKKDPEKVAVGDLIQWESSGALQFDVARRVRAIQEHEGAFWVFVEGSETGIPMDETIIEARGAKPPVVPPTLPEQTLQQARLGAGEREWLRGPLGKEGGYRIIVNGDLGPREIAKLIKVLEAQKEVYDEDA